MRLFIVYNNIVIVVLTICELKLSYRVYKYATHFAKNKQKHVLRVQKDSVQQFKKLEVNIEHYILYAILWLFFVAPTGVFSVMFIFV